jgi:hypothetical protein
MLVIPIGNRTLSEFRDGASTKRKRAQLGIINRRAVSIVIQCLRISNSTPFSARALTNGLAAGSPLFALLAGAGCSPHQKGFPSARKYVWMLSFRLTSPLLPEELGWKQPTSRPTVVP